MIMIIGGMLILVGIAMTYRFYRNSQRPRIEVKVDKITMEYVRNDHKKVGPQHRHAHVKYNYDGQNYESKVILHKKVKEHDWIQVSVNPNDPTILDIYAPDKEKIVIILIYAIGALLFGGSWWILDYFDAW